jgi:uncharacterized protein (DUF1684 family)
MTSAISIPTPAELAIQVDEHRASRLKRLTAEQGWLTIIAKHWLTEGAHRIGAASDAAIVLPADRAPLHLGVVTCGGGVVRFEADPSADVRVRGERVTSCVLRAGEGAQVDKLTFGSLTLELVRRGEDVALRVRDSEAPARRALTAIPAYPVDPSWFVIARLERFPEGERDVTYDDGDGRPQVYRSPGVLVFERAGVTLRVEPVWDSERRRLFVLFADATRRDETYGAGRFLYAAPPADGRVALDFNQAFNPPCAFSPYVACPLPPAGNILAVRVEAGEKRPA